MAPFGALPGKNLIFFHRRAVSKKANRQNRLAGTVNALIHHNAEFVMEIALAGLVITKQRYTLNLQDDSRRT